MPEETVGRTFGMGTAVVVGASIAGSSAAASLSSVFDQVIVIERDALPTGPTKRRGVPHSGQFHILSAGGAKDLEELFPGLREDLRKAGVPYADATASFKYASKFGWFPRQESGMKMLLTTRRYLEWYLRNRASQIDNVTFVDHARARSLTVENGCAQALEVQDLGTGQVRSIHGDLIIDASGRPSLAPEWFESNGYPMPKETVVDAGWGYATTYVEVPEEWDPGWKAYYVGPTVSGAGKSATRGASMWRQEGNLMVVTAQGCAGDVPPTDVDGFMDYISSFGSSEFKDVIDKFGRATAIEGWTNTANRHRDWAGLEDRPEGFVVVGDAAAAFNPIYGQGMTLAARGAKLLRSSLEEHIADSGADADWTGFAARFQKDLEMLVEPAWSFSTSSDFAVPGVTIDGATQVSMKSPESEFGDRVLALATEDPAIALKFFETINMVRSTEWMGDEELRVRVLQDWDRLGSLKRTEAVASAARDSGA